MQSSTKALILVLGGLFTVSVGWFVTLYVRGVRADSLDMEFAKALLQVGVVSVAGAVLSILVFGHQRNLDRDQRERESRREAAERTEELLKGTLARITAAYNRAKRARRKMRALGRQRSGETTLISHAAYDALMAEINDAQLDIETIKSDVTTTRLAYNAPDPLISCLHDMEAYLGELIEEYEQSRSLIGVSNDTTDLNKLPRLMDFLGPSKDSDFSRRFSDQHSAARASLRQSLLPPATT